MFLDHVTYQVPFKTIEDPQTIKFMADLGLEAVDASKDILEEGYKVLWFEAPAPTGRVYKSLRTVIHLCGGEAPVRLGLGHFCLTGLGEERYNALCLSHWCSRNSGRPIGSPLRRAWMEGPGGLRVEVRP